MIDKEKDTREEGREIKRDLDDWGGKTVSVRVQGSIRSW